MRAKAFIQLMRVPILYENATNRNRSSMNYSRERENIASWPSHNVPGKFSDSEHKNYGNCKPSLISQKLTVLNTCTSNTEYISTIII